MPAPVSLLVLVLLFLASPLPQARLAALDALRAKVDAQRLKLHKQGQVFVKKHQERKQERSRRTSARNSFEQAPPSATAGASNASAPHRSRPYDRSRSPVSLAAAATEALALASKAGGDTAVDVDADPPYGSSTSGSFARHTVDSGALHTPPCSPLNSFSGFGQQATAAASPGHTNEGFLSSGDFVQGGPEDLVLGGGVDSYSEGLVRLRSFPLVDAPTSMASSSDSRHGSGEHPAHKAAGDGGVAASTSTSASVHAALPVQSAFSQAAGAGGAPAAGGAGMAAEMLAAGVAGLSKVSEGGSGVQTSREGSAGEGGVRVVMLSMMMVALARNDCTSVV